jgi:hypothetical protein
MRLYPQLYAMKKLCTTKVMGLSKKIRHSPIIFLSFF